MMDRVPRLRLVVHTIVLICLINIANLILLFGLTVRLFSESWSWEIGCWTAERFWSYMQDHWSRTLNAEACVEVTGDELPIGESALVLTNHLAYSDYYLLQTLSNRARMLGKSRYFAKKELAWQLPFFGWAVWSIGMILVSRDWTSDEALIEKLFHRITSNSHPVWIILCPEGTRRTPAKLVDSQTFTRRLGKEEMKWVLWPRVKGFIKTVQSLRGSHVKYIYDVTLRYSSPDGQIPSLAEQLSCSNMAKAGYKFQIHVRRIPMSDLPLGAEGLEQWCEDLWREKDELLEKMSVAERKFQHMESAKELEYKEGVEAPWDSGVVIDD